MCRGLCVGVLGGFMCEWVVRECVCWRVCVERSCGCWQAWADPFKIKDTYGQKREQWKTQPLQDCEFLREEAEKNWVRVRLIPFKVGAMLRCLDFTLLSDKAT